MELGNVESGSRDLGEPAWQGVTAAASKLCISIRLLLGIHAPNSSFHIYIKEVLFHHYAILILLCSKLFVLRCFWENINAN